MKLCFLQSLWWWAVDAATQHPKTPAFREALVSFALFGTLCPRQGSVGLEDAGGPVGFEPVVGKRGVILTSRSSASGLTTAVDNTIRVSSSGVPRLEIDSLCLVHLACP